MIPCATCGAAPIGTFNDGSPRYGPGCRHSPISPDDAHPAYRAAVAGGLTERVVVELDESEMAEADVCGKNRFASAKRSHRKDYLGEDSLTSHLLGAQGERAFAKYLGVPWICTMNGFGGAADVAGCQVRAVPKTSYDLKVRSNDPDRIPVVSVVAHPPRFWIRGWIFAAEARKVGVVSDPGDRGRPAHFVDPALLRPMQELHRNDRARAAMKLPPLSEVRDAVPEAASA